MAQQVTFFKKSVCDYSNENVDISATQGNEFISYVLNRSNTSAWVTSGSQDSDNTTITVDFVDPQKFDNVLLVKHNFKAYTIKYWNGSAYTDFSTPVAETNNSAETTRHTFTRVTSSKIQIVVTGTMVADDDKFLYQLIVTELIGQLEYWPEIRKPTVSRNKQKSQTLSGKWSIRENIGSFAVQLALRSWSKENDLDIIEDLYDSTEGFLVWLCGGDEAQFFPRAPQGYRLEDIYLMKCSNEYMPEYSQFIYQMGLKITLDLVEIV